MRYESFITPYVISSFTLNMNMAQFFCSFSLSLSLPLPACTVMEEVISTLKQHERHTQPLAE